MANTARGTFPYPVGSDPADGPAAIQALATQMAAIGALITSGTLAARPTPSASDVDRFYWGTDTALLYRWSGSAWATVNPLALVDQAAGVGSMRTLGTGAAQAAPGNDSRILGASQITSGTFASRPAAGTANRMYRCTDTLVVYMDTGSTWIALGGTGTIDPASGVLAYNAAWPASPLDGQIVHRFAGPSGQVPIWTFRYVAANSASLRWVFIGGAPFWINQYNLPPTYTVVNTPDRLTAYLCGGSSPNWTPGFTGQYYIEPQVFFAFTPVSGSGYQYGLQFLASSVASVNNNGVLPQPPNMNQNFPLGDWFVMSAAAATAYNFYAALIGAVNPATMSFFVSAKVTPIYGS